MQPLTLAITPPVSSLAPWHLGQASRYFQEPCHESQSQQQQWFQDVAWLLHCQHSLRFAKCQTPSPALKDHARRQPVTRCKPLDALPPAVGISQRHHVSCACIGAAHQAPATVRRNALFFPRCYNITSSIHAGLSVRSNARKYRQSSPYARPSCVYQVSGTVGGLRSAVTPW